MSSKKIVPIYRGTKAYLIRRATYIHMLAVEDQAALASFDNSITPAYLAAFAALIKTTSSTKTDEVVVDEQQGYTQKVEARMVVARRLYNDVRYFAGKAFPEDPAILSQFGLDEAGRL